MALKVGTRFKRTIKNPATGQPASPVIYNVMNNSKRLSEQNITSVETEEQNAINDSLAILSAFGITVVEQVESTETTILQGKFLDNKKLETLEKTQDNNLNRLQVKKFKRLTTNKIAASQLFSQTINNPINEADTCQPTEMRAENANPINVIEIANDFINFSTLPLAKRLANT